MKNTTTFRKGFLIFMFISALALSTESVPGKCGPMGGGGEGGGGFGGGGDKGPRIPKTYEGTFVRWGAKYSLTRSNLTAIFYDKKSSRIREYHLPNENNARFIQPTRAVKILGNSMKIGTPVKIKALGSKILELGVKGDAPKVEYYVFMGKETVMLYGKPVFIVNLAHGKAQWSLMVENTADPSPGVPEKIPPKLGTDDLKPTPSTEIANKLSKFRKGDLVDIKYKTKDFRYTLVDIWPYELKISGKLIDKKTFESEKKKYEVAIIQSRRGINYSMLVPYEHTLQKSGISKTLAELPVDSDVEATGRKLGGVLRLDSISKKQPPDQLVDKAISK